MAALSSDGRLAIEQGRHGLEVVFVLRGAEPWISDFFRQSQRRAIAGICAEAGNEAAAAWIAVPSPARTALDAPALEDAIEDAIEELD